MIARVLVGLLLLLPAAVLPAACSADPAPGCAGSATCTRVLFVGNSYTSVNDLPGTFARLARAGGHRVETGQAASGGWMLADHAASAGTARALASGRWDIVVLQEQSQLPAAAGDRERRMYPPARRLVAAARAAGARPMLFLTWAHRDGWPERGLPGYRGMQAAVESGYLALAAEQHAPVAPVGDVWAAVVDGGSAAGLWAEDGSHPGARGTYLAACVFYASVFGSSPVGLGYDAGLRHGDAARLQRAAAAVLRDPGRWGLR